MMVALSGSVALVVTVENHKTMAKGGAQTPNHTMLHKMQIQKYSEIQPHKCKYKYTTLVMVKGDAQLYNAAQMHYTHVFCTQI